MYGKLFFLRPANTFYKSEFINHISILLFYFQNTKPTRSKIIIIIGIGSLKQV